MPFSDRHRVPLAALCALGLVGLVGFWGWQQRTGAVGYAGLLLDPARDGEVVSLSLVRVAAIDGPGHYRVEKGTLSFRIEGGTAHRVVGEDLSLGGRWDAVDQVLHQAWVEPREEGRQAKRGLGLLGLAWGCGWLVLSIRPGREGLELRG